MANNKLTFAIALNLLTENFKKGKNNVVNGFKSMQVRLLAFVSALGFGSIGLSNFVSKLISVAKETSRVTTALKNVSNGTSGYIVNQQFLNKLASDYKVEINSLTGNFAKFTAAATTGGMAIQEQQKIFKAVSKSIAAFSLTSDEANSVFLALSQMMSKGKIASQELRLQMGEKLPIAIQAMANAMGVSVAELDKMLSKGELMTNEVLPKFAEQLERMTPKIDTDNLQASLTDLENAFGDLSNKLGVENKYKKLVDRVTSIVSAAANNLKTILTSIVLGIVFFTIHGVTKVSRKFKESILERTTSAEQLHRKFQQLDARREIEHRKLEDLKTEYSFASGQRRLKIAQQISAQESRYAKVVLEADRAEIASKKAIQQKKLGFWRNLSKSGLSVIKSLGSALKSLWASFAPAAIITGLMAVINYFKNIHDEAKRIKQLFSDYQEEVHSISHTPEIVQLQTLQKLYNSSSDNIKEQQKYRSEIIKLLGTELKENQNINDVIAKRIELLETTAKVDFYTRKKIETEDKINTLKYQLNKRKEAIEEDRGKGVKDRTSSIQDTRFGTQLSAQELADDRARTKLSELVPLEKEISELTKIYNDATKNLEQVTEDSIISTLSTTSSSSNSEELSKLQQKYAKSLQELEIKLEAGIISQDDYNKSIDNLVQSSYVEAKLTNDGTVLRSNYFKVLRKQLENPNFNAQQAEINQIQSEYKKEVSKLINLKKNGIITEEEQNKALIELKDKTINQIGSMSDLTEAQQEYIKSLQVERRSLKNSFLPTTADYKPEKRDTTFDYKKSKTNILNEELELARKNYEKIKEIASDNLDEFEKELAEAMLNVGTLAEAVKIAEVQTDIEKLNKEIKEGAFNTADSFMRGVDGMVNSIERINAAFSNPDASGWEKIMSIWTALSTTLDSFIQIVEMINNLTKATEMLGAAKKAEAALDTAATSSKIANIAAEASAQEAALVAQTTTEVVASSIKTTKATTEMAAKSTSAFASIPFAGPALAAAQIAAFESLIAAASIPKFKDGGIVQGGPTSGDKILARVNAGEMILNQNQQSNLWKLLNSQSAVSGQSVNIGGRVRGADIYLALSNYMRSSGKKL